jgi:hypothetical protein
MNRFIVVTVCAVLAATGSAWKREAISKGM